MIMDVAQIALAGLLETTLHSWVSGGRLRRFSSSATVNIMETLI
jgi:hypothetical protein